MMVMHIHCNVPGLLACVSLLACQPSFDDRRAAAGDSPWTDLLHYPDCPAVTTTKSVSQGQISADIDRLQRLFERAYGGAANAEVLAGMRQSAASLGDSVRITTYYRWLREQLAAFNDCSVRLRLTRASGQTFDHPSCVARSTFASRLTFEKTKHGFGVPGKGMLLGCDGFDVEQNATPYFDLTNGRVRWWLSARAAISPEPLTCHFASKEGERFSEPTEWRSLETPNPKSKAGDVYSGTYGKTTYVRFGSFADEAQEALAKVAATGTESRSLERLVVDLRGNRGGDATLAREWLRGLTGGGLAGTPGANLVSSEVTLQGQLNDLECGNETGRHRAWQRQSITSRIDFALAKGEKPFLTRHPVAAGRGSPGLFEGIVVALVDEECTASCETFLADVRRFAPRTVVVGEATAGAAGGSHALSYRLPGSGIEIELPRSSTPVPPHTPRLGMQGRDFSSDARAIGRCLAQKYCRSQLISGL